MVLLLVRVIGPLLLAQEGTIEIGLDGAPKVCGFALNFN